MGKVARRLAPLAVVVLALVVSASSSATYDRAGTVHAAASIGDCNNNGVTDANEPSWANRDDDSDGFCNGGDFCPLEATATNDSSACQMQAITVPFRPDAPAKPHPTYSGAQITLKGIARYGGNQYMWQFGDGSATAWTAIADPYNLGIRHAYTGPVGRLFAATLLVRNSAAPSVVASATYRVEIENATASLPADGNRAQTDVRARMAVDEGLWYLHLRQQRSTYADGAPGFRQMYGFWNESDSSAVTCAAADAFEQRGDTGGRFWSTDPYAEDARRALDYTLVNGRTTSIALQQYGNPDVNGNGLGFIAAGTSNETYDQSVCTMALADSGLGSTPAPTGLSSVHGRAIADLVQDAVEFDAYGQNDGTGFARGGWGYSANDNFASGETFRWPVFAMRSAERMGATVPPFVRQQIPYFLNVSHYTAHDVLNGAWGWSSPSQYPSAGFTGAGIFIHQFLGDSVNHPDVLAAVGFLYRNWNALSQDPALFGNLGDSDAMYTEMRAFTEASTPITTIQNYDYNNGVQVPGGFDWYYSPASSGHEGFAPNIIKRQAPDGSWTDPLPITLAGTHVGGPIATTAWDVAVLAKGGAADGPIAEVDGPSSTGVNIPTSFDASGSTGTGLSYAWDTNGDGTFSDGSGATVTAQWATNTADANGVPIAPPAQVCVRVTDPSGASDSTCFAVVVKPGTHAPHAVLAPADTYVNHTVQLDASGSTDPDGDTLTYAWDLDDNGAFDDSTSPHPAFTAAVVGTYVVCVRVTDDGAPALSDDACMFVDVTPPPPDRAPVASIATPTVQIIGTVPQTVTLTSTSTDPDGDSLTYAWTFDDSGPTTGANAASATHTFGSFGVFHAHLTVSDGMLTSTADATVTILDGSPQPPTGLTATASGNSVALTWAAGANATGYIVLRSLSASGPFAQVGAPTSASFTDTGLAPGTTYVYEVESTNDIGTSSPSAQASATTAPAAPANVAASATSGGVAVTWDAVAGASGYLVERSVDGGPFAAAIPLAGNVYLDTDVAPGGTYAYRVSAGNAAGVSGPSSVASVTLPPAMPTGLAATYAAGAVSLVWNAATGATGYDVQRSLDGIVWSLVGTSSVASYSDSTVHPGGSYWYRVIATKGALSSAASEPASIDVPPAVPTGVAAVIAGGAVSVTWDPAEGAAAYSVERSVDGGAASSIGTTSFTSYVDTDVQPGHVYAYDVVSLAGATGSAPSAVVTVTIPVPAPSLTQPLDGSAVVGTSVPVAGSAAPGATVTVFDGAAALSTLTADPAGAFAGVLALSYGPHVLTARQTVNGVTGATSSAATIAVVPAAPGLAAPASVIGLSVAVTGAGAPGASVSILDGAAVVGSATVDASGAYAATVTLGGYGPHSLRATQTAGGETSAPSGVADLHAVPAAPTLAASGGPSPIAVSGTGVPGATVTILDGAAPVATTAVSAGGSYATSVALPNGTHLLTATQSLAGETSAASAPVSVEVLGTPPSLAYTGNAGTYTVDDQVSIHCAPTAGTAPIVSSTCIDIVGLAYTFGLGEHTYSSTVTDAAGLSASATVTFTVGADAGSLCNLTIELIQGSAKYRSLPAAARAAAIGVGKGLCQNLSLIATRIPPAARAALVNAYKHGLNGLVSAGWLTAAQAAALSSLADHV